MKKYVIKFWLLIGVFISFCGTCSKIEEGDIIKKSKILKHNYIIVNSVNNTPAEVEVSYSVFLAGNTENIVKSEKLTTPFVIGGNDVKVIYDSISYIQKGDFLFANNFLKRDYSPKGADYLSIKNTSGVELEYCVVGNEPIKFFPVEITQDYTFKNNINIDRTKFIQYSPTPIYRGMPILYLFKPELSPETDIFEQRAIREKDGGISGTIAEKITLKKPIFGEMNVASPMPLSYIIDVYKKEVTHGGLLYEDYDYYINRPNESIVKVRRERLPVFYGKIPAGQELSNKGKIWFINTHLGFYGNDRFE